jgi:hypothetical protein
MLDQRTNDYPTPDFFPERRSGAQRAWSSLRMTEEALCRS